MKLEGKHVILTGAASGIGLALLNLLAEYPLRLIAVDQNAVALQAACAALVGKPARITPHVCDLSKPENVDALFEHARSTFGHIDLFIANAGFAYYEKIETPDWAHIEKIFRVNVFSALYAFEKMQALNAGREHKTVITASAMAHIGVPGYALYSATKAALDRFADAYRWQMDDPRELMLVYPIATRTAFFEAAGEGVPTPWPSQPAETVAQTVIRGIWRDATRVYPSLTFQIILLLKRILPMHALVQYLEQRRFKAWLKRR
ncbi:MAG: SDR family NAD(P)-dependent oxidoreductase [Anaerolineales bacterium]